MEKGGLGGSRVYSMHRKSGLAGLRRHTFDDERHMLDVVEGNIGTLFPGLAPLKFKLAVGELRPDAIAFDGDENTFVVLACRNGPDAEAVERTRAYMYFVKRHRAALVRSHGELAGGGADNPKPFNWDKMYSIIVAPEFTRRQIEEADKDPTVELYEFGLYEDRAMLLARAGGGRAPAQTGPPDPGAGGSDAAAGHVQTDALHSAARARLLEAFPGAKEDGKERYTGFRRPGEDGCFCTLARTPYGLWICYSGARAASELEPNGFVRDAECLGAFGDRRGEGRYCSEIKDENDIGMALGLLKQLHARVREPTPTGPPDPGPRGSGQVEGRTHVGGLYSVARTMLLERFPGAVEDRKEQYTGFRRPGEDDCFCTVALELYGGWIYYSGARAASELTPDMFVQDAESPDADGDCRGEGRYRSRIEGRGDIENALETLRRLHAGDYKRTQTHPPVRVADGEIEPPDPETVGRRRTDEPVSAASSRLLEEFPGSVAEEKERYTGFRLSGVDGYICTLALTSKGTWIYYSGSLAASKLEPDGFVRDAKSLHAFGDCWGEGGYCSKIENGDDVGKALAVLKWLHARGPDPTPFGPPAGTAHSSARARLLEEFPGAVEDRKEHYTGFRRPGAHGYFCTLAPESNGAWIYYSGRSAASELKPDWFVRDVEDLGAGWNYLGVGNYCSKIENGDGVERALRILKWLHAGGPKPTPTGPPDTDPGAGDTRKDPPPSPAGAGDSGAAVKHAQTDPLHSAARAMLLKEFPDAVVEENGRYAKFRRPEDGECFCTLALAIHSVWIHYSGSRAASKLEPDGFVQDTKILGAFADYWGEGRYCSQIDSEADLRGALAILKRLHAGG